MPYYGPHKAPRLSPEVAADRLAKLPYRVGQAARNGSPEERGCGTLYVAEFGSYDYPTRYTATAAEVAEYKALRQAAYPDINF